MCLEIVGGAVGTTVARGSITFAHSIFLYTEYSVYCVAGKFSRRKRYTNTPTGISTIFSHPISIRRYIAACRDPALLSRFLYSISTVVGK
ncbi:hypothetical protein BDV36DRAFT_118258 [Aspergillus pseudocaelatus]|uniref:Uncharacterized protein n=1 Tax=Aspergillus pseudocaelatus TaxID=1825620 RepID=A0ABQ6WSN1_9EURO|nr:hypothetical protein BDV36DRAFT_118258 [Aspergillus pseudocaelatus]